MRPWEFLALGGAMLLVALVSLAPARRALPGSDERRAPLLVAALCLVGAVITLIAMLVRCEF